MEKTHLSLRQRIGLLLLGPEVLRQAERRNLTPHQVLSLFLSGHPVWTDWTVQRATREGYRASVWVYRCVRRIAEAVASVPWVVQVRRGGDWETVPDHEYQRLLEHPNPEWDGQRLFEFLAQHLMLTGNALCYPVVVGGRIKELWPVMPDKVRPIPADRPGQILAGYEVIDQGKHIRLDRQALIHFMLTDPANPYWGIGPLQAAARAVDTDNEAASWQKVTLQNRAITDGVFTFEQPLTEEQWQEARRQVREQYQGRNNARTPWVLGGGAKWQPMALTPAELDFLNSRRFTREEICAAFGVPPPLVGIYDRATWNNIETSKRIFWEDTIVPLLNGIRMVLNLRVAVEDDVWITYDTSTIPALQESFASKVDTAYKLWQMGVPFNQINEQLELGLEPVQGGDVGYLPASVLPAGVPVPDAASVVQTAAGAAGPRERKDPYGSDVPTKVPVRRGPGGVEVVPGYNPPGVPPYLKPIPVNARSVHELLRGYLAQREPVLVRWLYSTWTAAAEPLKYQEIRNAIATGEISPEVLQAWQQQYAALVAEALQPEWVRAQLAGGQAAAAGIAEAARREFVFDGGAQRIVEWIRARSGELAVNLTETQHRAVRAIIQAYRDRGAEELAQFLRPIIGLTPKEAQAVAALRAELLAQGLDAAEVERTVQNYAGFLHRRRALRIARTELSFAWNYGYHESVRQAVERGLIRRAVKVWNTAEDERTCALCGPLDGVPVELDETYPGGTRRLPNIYAPPAHPNCRCVLEYRIEVADERLPAAA